MGTRISRIHGRMVLDSRGNPTVEVDCLTEDGTLGRAMVPSGASTGRHEAVELRDGGNRWGGKGVDKAIANVNGPIADALVGLDASDQGIVDTAMMTVDSTNNKSKIGANAMLGASMACLRATVGNGEIWQHLSDGKASIPVPLMNILNGGAHANSNVDVQEFMIVPHGFESYAESLRAGVEIYHSLRSVLKDAELLGGVGDEGGFAPDLPCNEDGLRHVVEAIIAAGYEPGKQVSIALDVASQEFLHEDGYHIDGKVMNGFELGDLYSSWLNDYPIVSIEDPFGEDDWDSWVKFTQREGHRVQIVGDDLYVTNPDRLAKGIETGASNAILVKLNQIGTVTETLVVIAMAKAAGFGTIISHRSGETADSIIADIAVGTDAGQIKTGAPARSDRTSKYNQLLRISEKCSEYSKLF